MCIRDRGKGFAFVARQKRLHAEGDDFFVDLVFYNYLLKCFVLIDLKTGKLTPVSYTHLRAHETVLDLVCRLLLEKKNTKSAHYLLKFNLI